MLTKEEFEELSPKNRGYAVYMAGNRDDQPNVPNENCPYDMETEDFNAWNRGQWIAMLEAQDNS